MPTYTAYPDCDNSYVSLPEELIQEQPLVNDTCGHLPIELVSGINVLPVVSLSEARQRLDRWLAVMCPSLSRSRLKALLVSGYVTVDGAVATDPAHRVRPGQSVHLYLPKPLEDTPSPQNISLDIQFEDQHVIVINKPAGLVVHPAAGHHDGTVVNALLYHCRGELSGIGGVCRPGIVHRLDKDTSGLMVVAKTDLAHQNLAKQFADHTTTRAYYAIVRGTPYPRTGDIIGNIGRSPHNRQKMAVLRRGGKTAATHYQVIKPLLGGKFSLVECRLATGRTHQVRVHMAHFGHALVGDPLYGASSYVKKRELTPEVEGAVRSFRRQALHAYELGFLHPADGTQISLKVDLPEDMRALLSTLDDPVLS